VAINRFAFKYPDELANHGWRITHKETLEKASAYFELKNDSTLGRYTLIETKSATRVEYDLEPGDFIADAFELEIQA
jgi:hypothetical protein